MHPALCQQSFIHSPDPGHVGGTSGGEKLPLLLDYQMRESIPGSLPANENNRGLIGAKKQSSHSKVDPALPEAHPEL